MDQVPKQCEPTLLKLCPVVSDEPSYGLLAFSFLPFHWINPGHQMLSSIISSSSTNLSTLLLRGKTMRGWPHKISPCFLSSLTSWVIFWSFLPRHSFPEAFKTAKSFSPVGYLLLSTCHYALHLPCPGFLGTRWHFVSLHFLLSSAMPASLEDPRLLEGLRLGKSESYLLGSGLPLLFMWNKA